MNLSPNQIRANARQFSLDWKDESRERAESQTFWNEFFQVFGVNRRKVSTFEAAFKKLKGSQGFIDVFWAGKLVCEQKSRGQDLGKAYDQAIEYLQAVAKVAEKDLPRYVIVCDFKHLHIYDLEATRDDTKKREILIENLADHIELFGFISGYQVEFQREQEAISMAAAYQMGKLHNQLKLNGYDGHPLRVLLIRLLFCMFSEDTGIFNAHQFKNFIEQRTQKDGSDLGDRLSSLFYNLNLEKRQKNLDETIAAFPYINGELFAEMMPPSAFDALMRAQLIETCYFDWKSISPEIFGALFQSVMDDKERRNLGAHYTNEENILKVVSSLFLDELKADLAEIKAKKVTAQRVKAADSFHQKIANLTFLDPACGCGNFLVVAYRELRLLELEVIELVHKKGQFLDVDTMIRCNVHQFYGIEIEDFPAQIARVAMWLVDHQMNQLVSERFGVHYARIPLKQSAHIQFANALQVEWPITDFILGNPPFLGKKEQSSDQKNDLAAVCYDIKNAGNLDFVCGWYVKAARLMNQNPATRSTFVSTNSICQGEQVPILWSWMLAQGVHIQFAHRTFVWQSAAKGKAAVHCVIVGFGLDQNRTKTIFEYEDGKGTPIAISAKNINPYLVDSLTILIEAKKKNLCNMPDMNYGSFALDDGNYTLSEEEALQLVSDYPQSTSLIRPFIGGKELLNKTKRYCLWLKDCEPQKLKTMPKIMDRVAAVKSWRSASDRINTRKMADFPTSFAEIRQPNSGQYIAIPTVSSERRRYLPMAILECNIIASNQIYMIPNTTLYDFGIMTSIMHNAWMRTTCGRLKSDYRYSASIVYNNFPWPLDPTDKQKTAIETAAQAVLDARAVYPDSSLADLYDPRSMPPNLTRAHQQLDKAVDAAYGKTKFNTEAERVAFLFELYQQYTAPTAPMTEPAKPKKRK